jgi:hypothetical protein
MTSPPNLL